MQVELIMKDGDYFMLTDLMSPLDFKQILKGRLLSQKKSKKYGVVFSYEFDDGFKFGKKRGRKPKMEEPENPEDDDVRKESPDQPDEDYEEEIDPKRHDTFNIDEDDMSDLDDDTERNDDPDNEQDDDDVNKHFTSNKKSLAKNLKKKLNKAKKIIKKTRPKLEEPETDSPDTSKHAEEQDDDEDNKKDPSVNPGRITAKNEYDEGGVRTRKVKFEVEKRPNLFKDDLTIGRQLLLSKEAKKKIVPRTVPNRAYNTEYKYVKVICASCGKECKISQYEADAALAGKGRKYDPRNNMDSGRNNFIPNAAYRCPGCERRIASR